MNKVVQRLAIAAMSGVASGVVCAQGAWRVEPRPGEP
ncbi:hypothetical protein HDG33_001453 [Paraburkholderia sp. Cpub6]|nr:hypothetical protein [Paraburkholderia sp. Cpub6]